MLAQNRDRYTGNGSDHEQPPFHQQPTWGSEGGSVYDVTPIEHMRGIRELGTRCLAEAEQALQLSTRGREALQEIRDVLKGVYLLASYYERKVAAAIEALVYAQSGRQADRRRAERAADDALATYLVAARFMHERLDPYYERISGAPLHGAGVLLPELIEKERRDRQMIGRIFGWK